MSENNQVLVEKWLTTSLETTSASVDDSVATMSLIDRASMIAASLRDNGKLLIGGSATYAGGIADEFVSRISYDHASSTLVALITNSSIFTATGNNCGYEHVFDRQVVRSAARAMS